MKKNAKKLTLHRETIVTLGTSDLGLIAGGTFTTTSAHTSLACIEPTGCECAPTYTMRSC